MIALPAGLPLIRINQEHVTACDPRWLKGRLCRAARETNVPEWLAEDVSRGVETFLRNHYDGSVIEVGELFQRIRETLQNLGLAELAEQLDESPPRVRISLCDLVRRAGSGYELAFFTLLENRFQSAARGGARELDCYGLERCVRQLASARRWSRRCESLKTEITRFLQAEHEKAAPHCPNLSLSING